MGLVSGSLTSTSATSAMADVDTQGDKVEMEVNATMSSSISDLARIIDPSLISGGDGHNDGHSINDGVGSGLREAGSPLTASTMMPPLSGWTGLDSATETGTMGGRVEEVLGKQGVMPMTTVTRTMNGKNGDEVVDPYVDVDMHRPLMSGPVEKSLEGELSVRGRDEWIRQIERRKGMSCAVTFSSTILDHNA